MDRKIIPFRQPAPKVDASQPAEEAWQTVVIPQVEAKPARAMY